jgi:hypothetical protein
MIATFRLHPTPHQSHQGLRSKATGRAMAFKLIEAAQAPYRAVNASHPAALVRSGTHFERGRLVEGPEAVAG